MSMEIRLDCGNWIVNDYIISGSYEDGYEVKTEEFGDVLYYNISFEACLTWVWNS